MHAMPKPYSLKIQVEVKTVIRAYKAIINPNTAAATTPDTVSTVFVSKWLAPEPVALAEAEAPLVEDATA